MSKDSIPSKIINHELVQKELKKHGEALKQEFLKADLLQGDVKDKLLQSDLLKPDTLMSVSKAQLNNVNKLSTVSKAAKVKGTPLDALEALNQIASAYFDYKKVAETEQTKREAIAAWSEARAEETALKKEFLKQYLTESFAERRHVIDELFERLDQGIESGNAQVITTAMTSISDIVKSSPLEEAEKVMQAMSDPNISKIEF